MQAKTTKSRKGSTKASPPGDETKSSPQLPEPIANVIAVVLELDAIHQRFWDYCEAIGEDPKQNGTIANDLEDLLTEIRTNVLGKYIGPYDQGKKPVRATRILAGLPVEPPAEDDDESD